jgi:hypothetical protein
MAQPTERSELLSAWRALADSAGGTEGWRTIPLTLTGSPRLRAGRHFPRNEEALLVGFTSVHVPSAIQLPEGQGFLVSRVDLGADANGRLWLALSRRAEGSLDMFTLMSLDIISTLNAGSEIPEERSFQLFLARIRAWQDFMRRGTETTLGPEAEVGLFGELVFLRGILEAGVPPVFAVEGWLGPINGVQDFALGSGAVEVKTTIASAGFVATIASLEQMDDSARQPLFLAGVRICQEASGMSLPEIIENTRTLFRKHATARHSFDIKLLHAGYLDAVSDHYKRSFALVCMQIFRVAEGFPRLIRAGVPRHVIQARYELQIDGIDTITVPLHMVLEQLGVI